MQSRCRQFGRFPFTPGSGLLSLGVLLGALLEAGAADARTEILRWTHSRPNDVARWEAHVGNSPGSYNQILTLSSPTQDASGVFQSSIEVADTATVYVALRAVGRDASLSALSNERERAPESGGGGGGGGGDPTPSLGAGTTLPPVAGALQRADFSGSPLGNVVSGWVDTGASFGLSVNDALFSVVDVEGNRVLSTASNLADVHSHLTGADRSFANVRLTGRMAMDDASAALGVTAYSAFTSGTNYYRLGRAAGGSFRIEGRPGLSCASADTGGVPATHTWYVFQLSVTSEASQNRIQAKVWAQGTPEPSGPQAECVDAATSRRAEGTIGVWSSGVGQKYWDDLEVTSLAPAGGGGGPVAPPVLIQIVPVTN